MWVIFCMEYLINFEFILLVEAEYLENHKNRIKTAGLFTQVDCSLPRRTFLLDFWIKYSCTEGALKNYLTI